MRPCGELALQIAAKHQLFHKAGKKTKQYPACNLFSVGRRQLLQSSHRFLFRRTRRRAAVPRAALLPGASLLLRCPSTKYPAWPRPSSEPIQNTNAIPMSRRSSASRSGLRPEADGTELPQAQSDRNPAQHHQFHCCRRCIGRQSIRCPMQSRRPQNSQDRKRDDAAISTAVCQAGASSARRAQRRRIHPSARCMDHFPASAIDTLPSRARSRPALCPFDALQGRISTR